MTLLRAIYHRAGTSLVVLVVALCATAAATVGPTYYVAARHSILQDALTSTNVVGRGFQAVQQGPVQGTLGGLDASVSTELDTVLHGPDTTQRLFRPTVRALETSAFFADAVQVVPLVWRTDICAHLHFRSGRCPSAVDEVVASSSLAALNHWQLGARLSAAKRTPMSLVGVYDIPDTSGDYWFGRSPVYFPAEVPTPDKQPFDALFTTRQTIDALHGNPQGTTVVARSLAAERVRPSDVDALSSLDVRLNTSPTLSGVAVITGMSSTAESVHSNWSALAVPVVVVTAELLVLTWLLLFLVVTDAVEARGTEIALAKLRGYGAGRSLVFGLGEPVSLLSIALPAGALVGWALTGVLARTLLRPDTPVSLPALGWVGAAIAATGGIAAIAVAARRTLSRPVVEQWRRTGHKATDRGWVFDAIVLTGTVAGLVQLRVSGTLGSARHSALALLVPGLLGLGVAVVGSRLLPVLCQALFGRTRHRGGLGPFLAMRHIVRRPGGTRTTMILATAIALATFSVGAWSVSNANRTRVARVTVGAPTVMSVVVPPTSELGDVVDRIDPDGRSAAAVEVFDSGSTTLVAVQPQRFASVANWGAGFVGDPGRLMSGLHPPAPDPVVLDGDDVRVRLRVDKLDPADTRLTLDFVALGASAPTPVDLGVVTPRHRSITRVGSLAACPCTVRDLQLAPMGAATQVIGDVTITGIDVRDASGWHPVPHATDIAGWSDSGDQQVVVDSVGGGGLHWSFFATKDAPPTLTTRDRPDPLPAVVSRSLAGNDAALDATGLNAAGLRVSVLDQAANVPGAATNGVVVDLTYAERAAYGNVAPAIAQVWARGNVDRIRRGLAAAHVAVLSTTTSGDVDAELSRQGPALASVLFLADAAAAAVLAALAAVLGLTAAARRRRYEYAALAATGASRRSLYAALAIEQLVVIGFGALTGIGTGLVAEALAGRNVPEFVTAPAATLLWYRPSLLVLGVALGLGLLLLLASAALAAGALLRSVSADQLREAPS
ncbi:MAG: putative transport system permease protein [Frankiaceae bacterium]|jgi:hypothetical protein|nr:putative transport system permease protein [Frankiaceae bacterium]